MQTLTLKVNTEGDQKGTFHYEKEGEVNTFQPASKCQKIIFKRRHMGSACVPPILQPKCVSMHIVCEDI